MEYRTYGDMRDEVLREIDMEIEDFIQPAEVMGYFQDAVREANAVIQKLGLEDNYFKTSQTYSLTLNQATLIPPANIYAMKIISLTYSQPDKVYPIKRMKGQNASIYKQQLLQYPPGNARYMYDIENSDPTTGFVMKLYPKSQEDRANCIIMEYVRNVIKIVDDDSLVDIPEFYSFTKAYVTYKCLNKENTAARQNALDDLNKERQLMLEVLSEMTPDYDSEIMGDWSVYEEMS